MLMPVLVVLVVLVVVVLMRWRLFSSVGAGGRRTVCLRKLLTCHPYCRLRRRRRRRRRRLESGWKT